MFPATWLKRGKNKKKTEEIEWIMENEGKERCRASFFRRRKMEYKIWKCWRREN